ncbi:MAG: hypothetical protein K1X48_08355 [Burkholderiaceae bacterium]|nr:hypothetical protein [Burkholderiaceae bacterium]
MSEHPAPERNHAYVFAVQNALFAFQMIEEGLKLYVGLSYEILKRSAPSPVTFNFDPPAIQNAPLSRLIKMFGGVSANNQLIGELRKIEGWRNFCAHRAYTHEFMSRQSGAPVSVKDVEEVQTITTFAVNLVERIGNDMLTLRETHRILFRTEHESDSEAFTPQEISDK